MPDPRVRIPDPKPATVKRRAWRDQYPQRARAREQRYRDTHREEVNARQRRWRERHLERERARQRAWWRDVGRWRRKGVAPPAPAEAGEEGATP